MTGAPVAPHYCAAKAALLGFTKAWAKELAPWNIHVNAVAPGGVKSGGPIKLDSAETLKAKEARVPLKRYCEPVEIAYAVAYLASPEADFVTGQVISPNGGEVIVGY
jgi:3-oxoacyl-[acyl-carrier protein] reductase